MGRGRADMEVRPDGVAVITISNPPVNSLSVEVLLGLKTKLEEALQRHDVKALVLTGSGGKFSGGFDITTLLDLQNGIVPRGVEQLQMEFADISVKLITEFLEGARKPLVAAIDGLALGGGLEIAMACHGRISTPQAQLGLPELQLGVIPGFGGTQRLPRLVGLSKALEMILLSKPIKSEEANELGLVDAIVPPSELLNTACRWALDIAEYRKPWLISLYRTDKIEPLGEAREIIKFTRMQAQKRAANFKHPLVCLHVIEEGIVSGSMVGLLKEASSFQELLHTDTAKSLVHVFLAQRATSKVPGVTDIGLEPRKVRKVAVVGGGLMGSGIATALILSGYPVVLKEVNTNFLNAGLGRIKANLQSRVKKGKMSEEKYEKVISLVQGTIEYDKFSDIDMVIEAVIENLKLKQQIFSDLEKICPEHCVLATNTSTIDLNLIGEKTNSQSRIVGAHFFSPAHIMPLLEIVRTEKTSSQVIIDLMDVGKKIKKTPIVVGNCTGFAVNRMFFPYTQSALFLIDLGLDVYQIDKTITGFGMPMGPFRLADLVGFEVAVATGTQYLENFSDRVYKSLLIPMMLEDKRTGEKTLKGFYVYDNKRKARPDPEIKKYVEKSREVAGLITKDKPISLTSKDIIEMIFFPVVNEACRVLDEGIAVQASDLDIASVMGMGFPPYRGGLMFWAESLGSSYIYSRLKSWAEAYGDFFRPSSFLEERARTNAKLSAPKNRMTSRL